MVQVSDCEVIYFSVFKTLLMSRANLISLIYRKGKEIKESPKYTIIDEGPVKKLIVKKCTIEDAYEYSVVAINVKSSSKLKVESKCFLESNHLHSIYFSLKIFLTKMGLYLSVIETPPKINIDSPKLYKVKKGEDVEINVKFSASPMPTEEWTVNGRVVSKTKRIIPTIQEESATLTIKKIEEKDIGDYTLKLVNSHGEAEIDIKVVIVRKYRLKVISTLSEKIEVVNKYYIIYFEFVEAPSPPGKPEPSEVTDDTITLHWKEPESDGNSPITEYILEYHDREESS